MLLKLTVNSPDSIKADTDDGIDVDGATNAVETSPQMAHLKHNQRQ